MKKPLKIIDIDFNYLAEIDDYESLAWRRRWHKPGDFELHINVNKQYTEQLQKGNIVLFGDKAGIIRHREIKIDDTGKGGEELVIKGSSLSCIVGRRITIPPAGYAYDKVTANIETIMKGYVDRNCINPVDTKRKIPLLELASDQARGMKTTYQTRLKQLDEELEKLSLVSGLGWDITLDIENKKWVFDVFEGRSLTAGQAVNPPVIFSVDFDNIKAQQYVDSESGYRNIAYVGGQGEGVDRAITEVGEDTAGLDRYETFVDARDLEDEINLPDRGRQKLSEMQEIKTFESEIMTDGPFRYGEDWDLGDIVTVQNKKWDLTLDTRITEVTEIYEKDGFRVEVTFGSNIPTLVEKIKQEIDSPLVERTDPVPGEPGTPGKDGVGLQYNWQSTKLGVKREDEATFIYTDLQGPKGDKGDTGPQGERGIQGERGLQGPKGDKGDTGPKGDKPAHQWLETKLQFENPDGTWGALVDLKGEQGPEGPPGPKGDKGDKGDPGEAEVTKDGVINALGYTPANSTHKHSKSEITDFPSSMLANGGNADAINIADTRSVNDTPQDIFDKGKKITSYFKFKTAVNNPPVGSTGAYVFIVNICGWGDSSGGYPIQIAYGKEGLAYRQGISSTAWGAWKKIANIDDAEGTNIKTGTNTPSGLSSGDWWFKEV